MKKILLLSALLLSLAHTSSAVATPQTALPFDEETLWDWADAVPKPSRFATHTSFLKAVDHALRSEREQFESSFAEYLTLEKQVAAPSYRGVSSESARLRALEALFKAYLIVASTQMRGDWDITDRHHLPRSVGAQDFLYGLSPLLLAVGYRVHLHMDHASLPWFKPVAQLPQYEGLIMEAQLSNIGLTVAAAHLLFYAFSTFRDRERMGEYQRHGRGAIGLGSTGQGSYRRFFLAGFERVRDLYRSLRLRFLDTDRTWEEDFLNSLRMTQSFEVPEESRESPHAFRIWLGKSLRIANECEVALDRYLDSRS